MDALRQSESISGAQRSIFREKAIKHAIQRREKDVLPRLVSPHVFLFLWVLLILLLIAGFLSWWGQVPVYISGSGIIEAQQQTNGEATGAAVILIFLPVSTTPHLHAGLPAQIHIGASGPTVDGTIQQVESGIISPLDAQNHYQLGPVAPLLIREPSYVVIVSLRSQVPAQVYSGSIISAQIQVGSRRVFSLIPGLNSLIGN